MDTGDGWHVSERALEEILADGIPDDKKKLQAQLLNIDMKEYGMPVINDSMDKATGKIKTPLVVQISRLRDVGRPSTGDHSCSGLFRLFLTDGNQALSALILETIPGFSEEKTTPGMKLLLHGVVPLEGHFALLSAKNCTLLGGRVDKLYEKWIVERNSVKGVSRKVLTDAPKWIPFEKRNSAKNAAAAPASGFRANDVINAGKGEKENAEKEENDFEKRRKEALEAAAADAAEKNFAKVSVEVNKKQMTEEERVDLMKKKFEKRSVKEDERRERRGGGRGRGRRGNDSDGDVPAEFSRPSQPSTLFDFVQEKMGPMPVQVAAPEPAYESPRPARGGAHPMWTGERGGGRGGEGMRGRGRGEGMRGRGGRGRDGEGMRDRGIGEGTRGRGGGERGRRGGDRGRGGDYQRGERGRGGFNQGPSQANSFEGAPRNYGIESATNGMRGMNVRGRGPGENRRGRDGEAERGGFRGGGGGATGGNSAGNHRIPSLFDAGQSWKIGDICQAPWNDGNFYTARLVFLGPRDNCTVSFVETGDVSTVSLGALIRGIF